MSGDGVGQDGSARFTESYGKEGSIGLLMGAEVLKTAISMVR